MTDYTGIELRDEHVAALRSLLELALDVADTYEKVTEDASAVGHTLMVYSAFAVAVRRKFSPTYTLAQVIRYVADLRISLKEEAQHINPRVVEGMIRAVLGDETFRDREPYGADTEAMLAAEMTVLLDLADQAGLEGPELDEFLRETADYARRWLAARQAQ